MIYLSLGFNKWLTIDFVIDVLAYHASTVSLKLLNQFSCWHCANIAIHQPFVTSQKILWPTSVLPIIQLIDKEMSTI